MLVSGFCLVSVSIARDVQIHVVYVFKQILYRIERNSTGTHSDKQQTNYCITSHLRRMLLYYLSPKDALLLLEINQDNVFIVTQGSEEGGREGGSEGGREGGRD